MVHNLNQAVIDLTLRRIVLLPTAERCFSTSSTWNNSASVRGAVVCGTSWTHRPQPSASAHTVAVTCMRQSSHRDALHILKDSCRHALWHQRPWSRCWNVAVTTAVGARARRWAHSRHADQWRSRGECYAGSHVGRIGGFASCFHRC